LRGGRSNYNIVTTRAKRGSRLETDCDISVLATTGYGSSATGLVAKL
jgi:hypothetical protein